MAKSRVTSSETKKNLIRLSLSFLIWAMVKIRVTSCYEKYSYRLFLAIFETNRR